MMQGRRVPPLRHVRTLFDVGAVGALADEQLLERFRTRDGEEAELAFAALVERHGPMALRVCRGILRDEHDAEDAFQAVFLVLARRSGTLRVCGSLGPWIHQVACRVAARSRAASLRRRRHERAAAAHDVAGPPAGDEADRCRVLHEELARLPDRYRLPIVLCCLQGCTREQAAEQLGWPAGTVQSRIARGRERLRGRLMRRGVASHAAMPAMASYAGHAAPRVGHLAGGIARAASRVATGRAVAGLVSDAVITLTEGATTMMFFAKAKRAAALTALALASTGLVAAAQQGPGEDRPPGGGPHAASGDSGARADAGGPRPPRAVAPGVIRPKAVLRVEVAAALPGRPITGERLVRPDGTIHLGYYGPVPVAGLTPREAEERVTGHLREYLGDHALGLVVKDPISGVLRPGQADRVSITVKSPPPPAAPSGSPGAEAERERRLDEIERKLDEILGTLARPGAGARR